MKIYHITVSYDELLVVDSDELKIEAPLDSEEAIPAVLWTFEGIEEKLADGYVPSIKFGGSETGPFANLSRWPFQVAGCGNLGSAESFEYQAQLVPPNSSPLSIISSAQASLQNEVGLATPDTSPVVEVTIGPGDDPVLTVEPNAVGRVLDQSIVWRVVGEVPAGFGEYYARVVIVDVNGSTDSELNFGPFTSWENYGVALIGSGLSRQAGVFNYYFELASITHEGVTIRSSPDPTIDDRGEPPVGNVYPAGSAGRIRLNSRPRSER